MQYLINQNRQIVEKNYRNEILTREEAFPRNTNEDLIFFSGELPKYWAIEGMEVVELSKFEAYQNGLCELSEGEKVENEEIVVVEKLSNYHTWNYDKMEWIEDLESLRTAKSLELENVYKNYLENYTFTVTLDDDRDVQQGISDNNRNDLAQLILSMNNQFDMKVLDYVSENGTEPNINIKVDYMSEITSMYIFRSSEMSVLNLIQLKQISSLIDKEYQSVYFLNKQFESAIYASSFENLIDMEFIFDSRTDGTGDNVEEVEEVEEQYKTWSSNEVYDYLDLVTHEGVDYIANFWTQGDDPATNCGGTEMPWSLYER